MNLEPRAYLRGSFTILVPLVGMDRLLDFGALARNLLDLGVESEKIVGSSD